jgi:hypothetical protein
MDRTMIAAQPVTGEVPLAGGPVESIDTDLKAFSECLHAHLKARGTEQANKLLAGPPLTSVNDDRRPPVDLSCRDVERWENEGGAPRMRASGDVGRLFMSVSFGFSS